MIPAAPPQASAAEIKAEEEEATLLVQRTIIGAVLLYFCEIMFLRFWRKIKY
jgi:hypothetical protein